MEGSSLVDLIVYTLNNFAYLACGDLKRLVLLRLDPFCTREAQQKIEDEDCYLNFHFKIYYDENQILFFGRC